MRRTTGFGTAGRRRAIAESTRLTGAAIVRWRSELPALDLEHQPPQEVFQLPLLVDVQRLGDERLLRRLDADRVVPGASAGLGQLDLNGASVVGGGQPPDQN